MADAIKKCGTDIVGLNEMRDKGVNADYENQAAILADLTGMKNYYFVQAILLNLPFTYKQIKHES